MTTNQLKILIADDEPLAREIVRRMLIGDARIESILEAENGDEAFDIISHTLPDIVYLDIQMPGMNGFELLAKLRRSELKAMPVIIFITAYDEYALKAFEFYALDYLVKPFDPARFRETLDLAINHLTSNNRIDLEQELFQIVSNLQNRNEYLEWVSVKTNDTISLLKIEEIRWIQAQGNYVLLNLSNNVKHLLREKMDILETKLDPKKFLRIHRSTIINIHFIKGIEVWGRGEFKVVMSENRVFNVSRSFRENFSNFLSKKVL